MTLLHVGNIVNKESQEELGKLIDTVFKSGHNNRMQPDVIIEALRLISKVYKVENISVSGCTFKGADTGIKLSSEE